MGELCPDCKKNVTVMIGIRTTNKDTGKSGSYFSIGRACVNCRTLRITNKSYRVIPLQMTITQERST